MIGRRPLGVLLGELAEGALQVAAQGVVRATSVELTLPIELGIRHVDGEPELLGDVPLFITRTAFDPAPGRVSITWAEAPL